MRTHQLIDRYAGRLAQLGIDMTPQFVEDLREERSGIFGVQTFQRTRHWRDAKETMREEIRRRLFEDAVFRLQQQAAFHTRDLDFVATQLAVKEANRIARQATSERELVHNIVTNEGLADVLDVVLDADTQITTWYVTMASTNTTAAATMTAAVPVFTEIDATDVTETVRQAWSGGSVTGTTTASIDNSASPATYTCDTAGFTAYGAALIGGGTSAFGNTAGVLYSYSLFASAKAMSSTDTIDVTYTFTATDS